MKKSVEDVIKLIALKQPIPTVLKRPESTEESLIGGGPTDSFCGVVVPIRYRFWVNEIYRDMVDWMYCRPHPIPGGGCTQLSLGPPLGDGSMPADQWVTDRDKPLSWQRIHPDFNPDDPATWGSLFGPNGFAAEHFAYWLRYADENGHYGNGPFKPGVTQADIDAMIELVRQLYIARCSFAVAQTGSCCEFSEFGTATCSQTTSSSCLGVFTAGGNCNGANPCGLAKNPVQQNDQGKKQTPIMDMVLSALKGNKMSDSIENKLRNISKSVKAPIPTPLFRSEEIVDNGEAPFSPCGIRLSNPTQSQIYDAIVYGIYDKSPGMPVIGGNDGRGQVTNRDPLSPLWKRTHPEWNPADPNTWGAVFGPGGWAERLVRFFHCNDTNTDPLSKNCPGLTDADINRMVEELKQLFIIKCGFLVQEGGSCCTFSEFGTAECNQVGSVADCKGVYKQGGDCSGDNPCGGLMPNPIQKNEEVKKQKQVMDMVMSMMKIRKQSTGGCVSQTVNGPLCIASDVTKEDCQKLANLRNTNVWWFNGQPCDMESVSRVDYNNGGILMKEKK